MIQKIKAYANDVVREMRKVTWPTQEELKESTAIVLVLCLIFAAFTYIIDFGISNFFKMIF